MSAGFAVIGDALLDVLIRPAEALRAGGDVPAAVRLSPGGQGANVSVHLARRGARVRLTCGLAADATADLLWRALEADAVEVRSVPVAETGVVAIFVDENGERAMLSQRAPFALDHLDVGGVIGDARWVIVSGYALTQPDGRVLAGALAAAEVRRAVLGCSVARDGLDGWSEAARALRADVAIINRDEGHRLVGGPDDPASIAARVAGAYATLAIVTSADGASAAGPGVAINVPAAPTSGMTDATGAGDAFAAAVIAGIAEAWPCDEATLSAAMREGVALAADVVTGFGAQRTHPDSPARPGGRQ